MGSVENDLARYLNEEDRLQAAEDAWERECNEVVQDFLDDKTKLRYEFYETVYDAIGTPAEKMTVADLFDKWVYNTATERQRKTAKDYYYSAGDE